MKEIKYKPIGIIHSPVKEPKGSPIQPEYADGLKDSEGFSHVFLIYHFHLSNNFEK